MGAAAMIPHSSIDTDGLIAEVDQALYEAKKGAETKLALYNEKSIAICIMAMLFSLTNVLPG